jgi:excisionase family DNA binding protein
MSDLARALLDELAGDPAAVERLRELVAPVPPDPSPGAVAYTPRTLAAELGRSERSIRAAIARGELQAVKRGRGWVIGADAVAAWAHAESSAPARRPRHRGRPRTGPGPMARALPE